LISSLLKNYSQKGSIELHGKIQPENVVIEFGSPNIAKPLHMGHLRSTVTGHYVSKICMAAGHNVTTICYLGDWGTQFGVLHAGLSKWLPREEDVPMTRYVHKLGLHELLGYYVRAIKEEASNEEFATQTRKLSLALEKQERTALDIWATVREKTINHLGTVWNQFGIVYDVIQGESEFAIASDHTEETMEILKEKADLVTGDDGCVFASVWSKGKLEGNQVQVPLVKADGSSLYLLRDIAAARSRLQKFKFDRMMYVVDKTQEKHFSTLFTILSQIGMKSPTADNHHKSSKFLQHITFGRVLGMSTRSGNFMLLSDVINDGTELMEDTRVQSANTRRQDDEQRDKMISTKLAISALIVHSLKQRRNQDCKFDWIEALKPNGDTGVRLQYTHARLYSLEQKQSLTNEILNSDWELDMDYVFKDPMALDLALTLLSFEDAFWTSYNLLEPCILLTYIFKLSDRVSKCLKQLQVQTEPNPEIAKTRLRLFMLSRKILAFSMDTVGIEPMNEI
jgi:arginyl-tRNA synthetase